MRTLKIQDSTYSIPQDWSDISLKKFLQIRDHESLIDKMPLLDYNIEFISIITEIPTEDLLSLTPTDISNLIKDLMQVTNQELKLIEEPIIIIDGITYVMDKHPDKMNIGQFIDLDLVTKEGDVWDNAHKICASFMRPAKIGSFGKMFKNIEKCDNYIIDKYDYQKLLSDSEIFYQKMPMTYIYTCVTFFFTFRQNLTRQYEGLFPSINDGQQVELIDSNEPKTQQQIYNDKWNWYSVLIELAQGDLSRLDEMTELNLILVLNHLSYQKETADLIKSQTNKGNVTTY